MEDERRNDSWFSDTSDSRQPFVPADRTEETETFRQEAARDVAASEPNSADYNGQTTLSQGYTGAYTNQPYSGRSYNSRAYTGQAYTDSTYTNQGYTGQGYSGQASGSIPPRTQASYPVYDRYYGTVIQDYTPQTAPAGERGNRSRKESSGTGTKVFVAIIAAVILIATVFGGAVIGAQLGYGFREQTAVTQDQQPAGSGEAVIAEGGKVQRSSAAELQNSTYASVSDIVADVTRSLATVVTDQATYATAAVVSEDSQYVYLVTTYHALAGAASLQMVFGDDTSQIYKPEVAGVDVDTDLAVLKLSKASISEAQRKEIKIATFGDSSSLVLADLAITFSSPMGYFCTPSLGTISGLGRSMTVNVNGTGVTMDLVQTDAAVNTSGILVNGRGEIVGVTMEMTIEGSEGIGFAIPSNTAADIVEEILEKGFVTRPYMGFSGYDVMNFHPNSSSESWAEYYDLPMGVLVAEVVAGSPVDAAGLKPYDVIISFNGQSIDDFDDMKKYLNQCEIGQSVKIEVIRGYMEGSRETVELTLTVGQKPQP